MQQNRRKADDTRDLVIQAKTALEVHTETDEQHFREIKETFSDIGRKLDRLNRNQIFAAGVLAALMFLMNFPQLINIIAPVHAEVTHKP